MAGEWQFLLQLLVVGPVCQFLLKSPVIHGGSRVRGLAAVIAFLAVIALVVTYSDFRTGPPNFYRILDVDVNASISDIKKAYKTAAIRLHPDKNNSPDAQEQFTWLSQAYETLLDADARRTYDRYGPDVRPHSPGASMDVPNVNQLMFYLVWFVLTYVMCLSKEMITGRTYAWVALFLTAVLEYQVVFSAWNPIAFILSRTPPFEIVRFLHALYPSIMNACRTLAMFTYVDYDARLHQLCQEIVASNVVILNTLQQIEEKLERKGGSSGSKQGSSSVANGVEMKDDGTGNSHLPAGVRLRNQKKTVEALQAQLAQTQPKSSGWGIPSWAIMIGLYVLFNYVLQPTVTNRSTHSQTPA